MNRDDARPRYNTKAPKFGRRYLSALIVAMEMKIKKDATLENDETAFQTFESVF